MNWMPSDEWYEDLFDECKTKADVIEKATDMIKRRDKEAHDKFHQTIEMLDGHRAALEIIKDMQY
tara:strand:+ start:849 stop:1043 length:195 start_codon:yes stop_codon:yes gene_type:complete